MPRLIALNGPPACGKSTVARRYAADHPPALSLDVDLVRDLIGGEPDRTGPLARDIAVAAARTHLTAGHDVVVPQYLGHPEFLDRLSRLAADVGATFHEVVLFDSKANAVRRFAARGGRRSTAAEVSAMHDRLVALIAARRPVVIPSHEDTPDHTYQTFLTVLTP